MNVSELPGLQINSPLVTPQAANFRPPIWPPPGDFPMVIDASGKVVSRFRDSKWSLIPWAGKPLSINFNDGPTAKNRVTPENALLFRQVTAWWLLGPNGVQEASTLKKRHDDLKILFVVCSEAGISASDLSRFPKVIEQLSERFPKSRFNLGFGFLHDLWMAREALGFVLLDEAGLELLSRVAPEHSPTQTAYIPPRIWTYQVLRLRECLDDYLAHRQKVEDCYRFCLSAFEKNAGGLLEAAFKGVAQHRQPFKVANTKYKSQHDYEFHGAFRNTAVRFGIDELLGRWVNAGGKVGVRALSNYLSLISQAGLAYVLNFSLMRIDEGSQLRADCYSVERDQLGEDIHLLGGVTTKTVRDGDARWIVSPSVRVAIDAMTSVAHLRIEAGVHNPSLDFCQKDISNPLLQVWSHEPWSACNFSRSGRKQEIRYVRVLEQWPKLFDKEQLRITEADLALANRMTFGLDPLRFAAGKIWPLAWHQLRRTGAVNMLSTGLVSDGSLQYQLKHALRAMSRYYGQNYYHLKAQCDDDTRGFYLRQMYQSVAREFAALQSGRFVSPHGETRKEQILISISEKDHKRLVRDAKAGRVSYHETLLGGCANPGPPCPLGGITMISGCMGSGTGKPCQWALLDREKRPLVVRLREMIVNRLKTAEPESRLQESLQDQLESAERAIHVLNSV